MEKKSTLDVFFAALIIAVLAASTIIIDQLLKTYMQPVPNQGFVWITFQAWAVYFLAGCTIKGGVKSFLSYVTGIGGSILIIMFAGHLSTLGFWTVPTAVFLLVIPIIMLEKVPWLDFIPALFIGSGACFAFMNYVPGATFANATCTILLYCALGLFYGYITVALRQKFKV